MNYLLWKAVMAYLPLVGILAGELGSIQFGWWTHGERAAFYALCASISFSATLISGRPSKESQAVDLLARTLLLGGITLSAYHWLLSEAQADDPNRYILFTAVAILGSLLVLVSGIVAMRERKQLLSERNGGGPVATNTDSGQEEACGNATEGRVLVSCPNPKCEHDVRLHDFIAIPGNQQDGVLRWLVCKACTLDAQDDDTRIAPVVSLWSNASVKALEKRIPKETPVWEQSRESALAAEWLGICLFL